MTHDELLLANTTLRDTVEDISDLLTVDFDPQDALDSDDLQTENEHLRDVLTRARDLLGQTLDDTEDFDE